MALGTINFTAIAYDRTVGLQIYCQGMTRVVLIERMQEGIAPGFGQIVRGSENTPTTGPDLFRGNDWEAPQGVPLTYRCVIEDEGDSTVAEATVELQGTVDYGGDYLMPVGRPELGMNVIVEYGGIGELYRDVQRSVVQVLNRPDPVVVTYGRKYAEGTLTFLTLTLENRRSLMNVLKFPALMFVTDPEYGFGDPFFVSPGAYSEVRTSGFGGEPSRRWRIEMTGIERPPTSYATDLPATSWQEQLSSGDTWEQIFNSNERWYDVAGYVLV